MALIQIKRGLQAGVEKLSLAEGELAVALDTGNLYIGKTAGKVLLNPTAGIADTAKKLQIGREFSVTGDATAQAVIFDGTQNVKLDLVFAVMAGLQAGTYTKVTVDSKGRVTAGAKLAIEDLPDIPKNKVTGLPTKVSELLNDRNYQTEEEVSAKISALVSSAPETLDTLNELASALGNDPNFAATITAQIGGREPLLKNAVEKESIADADLIILSDSAAGTKKTKISALKAVLRSYFDTLYNKYTHPAYTPHESGLYKITVDTTGHVSSASKVTKTDITGLGIPGQDTTYSLPTASQTVKGGIKIGSGLVMSGETVSLGNVDGGTF